MKAVLTILATLLISLAFAQVPQSGLIGFFPFTGNADDQSIDSNDGIVNGALLTVDRHGNSDAAYAFNGTSDYIEIPSSPNYDLTGDFTISMWFQVADGADASNNQHKRLITRWTTGGTGTQQYNIYYTENNVISGFWGTFAANNDFHSASDAANHGEWHHLVMTYTSTAFVAYIDDIQAISTSINPWTLNAVSQPTIIGGGGSGDPMPVYCWEGKIDDLCFYDRVVTRDEVSQLYKDTTSNIGTFIKDPVAKSAPQISSIMNSRGFVTKADGLYDVAVFNLIGQKITTVKNQHGMNNIFVDQSVQEGIYLAQITNKQGHVLITEKIIIGHEL